MTREKSYGSSGGIAHNTGSTTPVKGTLYRTDDGGTSWGPVKAEKTLEEYLTHGEEIVQLEFVDDEYGVWMSLFRPLRPSLPL